MMNSPRADVVRVRSCHERTRRGVLGLLVLGLTAVAGCDGERGDEQRVLRLRLEEGGTVGARVEAAARPGQVAALLVYDASMCFACSPYLTRWEDVARSKHVPLILLLRTPPSPGERRAIRLQRVPVTGVMHWRTTPPPGPSEYLVRNGHIIAMAEGEMDVRRKRLWEHPLVGKAGRSADGDAGGNLRVRVPDAVLAKRP